MSKENLELWESVEVTDQKFAKKFKRAGGFSGTSIDPMYQIKRATAVFGPMGDRWGLDIVKEQIVDIDDVQKLHYVQIDFWYYNSDDKKCHFHQFGQTMMVARSSSGPRVIEEAPKMSLTDALTKSLSWLGFSSDVWFGRFDGNKYWNDTEDPSQPPSRRSDQEHKDRPRYVSWLLQGERYR